MPGRKLFRVGSEQPGCPTDESSLRRQWNRELITGGTLPLIPESLLELHGRASVSPEEMRELVAGLTSTELFSKNRSAICSAKAVGISVASSRRKMGPNRTQRTFGTNTRTQG
jgi:hypothetical protein